MAIDEYDIPLTTIRGVSRPDRLDPRTQALLNTVLPALMDRLRFGPEIAAGGVGAVRVAFDRSLQRRIAAKVLHDRSYGHYLLVHGFIREAQVTGQLDHPNIVTVHELGRDQLGRVFYTMKLIIGTPWSQLIGEGVRVDREGVRTKLELRDHLEILLEVANAIAFAHSREVIHRDIKPGNVMVGDFGEVYLISGRGRRRGAAATPSCGSARPSQRGIIWARDGRAPVLLGALLYELLTGQPPYSETETRLILRMAELGDVASPDTVVGSAVTFPPELVRITMKALAPRPEARYPSVIALQDDIHALLRGGGSFEVRSFPADTLVIREGEVGEAAYIVQKGKLQVFKAMGNARLALRKLGPGDVFGETAIFAASPRTASVIALEDSELIVVTRAVIDQELGSMQPWLAAFVRTLASRFGGVDDEAATPPHDKNG